MAMIGGHNYQGLLPRIASIDPADGTVQQWIDVSHLRPRAVRGEKEAVLNGIAWDEKAGRLFVTGKHWPQLFEITIDGTSGAGKATGAGRTNNAGGSGGTEKVSE